MVQHPVEDEVQFFEFIAQGMRNVDFPRRFNGCGQAGDVTVEVKTVQTLDGESDMLVEDRFNRGQGFRRSFHGLSTRKLSLPAREIEAALWVCPVPRRFVGR